MQLYIAKLQQRSRLHVIQACRVSRVQEYLHLLVDLIHEICTKKGVSCEGLIVLPLEAVNVTWSCGHDLDEGNLVSEVLSRQAYQIPRAVTELMCGCHRVDMLV